MGTLLSLLTLLISAVFSTQLLRQFWQRRRPHQVVWAAAILFFGVGVSCQFLAELGAWTPLLYRLWYLTGAVLTAAYLGQGTVYLQSRSRRADVAMGILLLASLGTTVAIFRAPLNLRAALAGGSISGAGMPGSVRLLTPFFNIFGTVALVGGAARSSWYFLWNGGDNRRAVGTALIAAGSFIVAAGGTLTRFNVPEPLYVSEFAGLLTIYLGFVFTNRPVSRPMLTGASLKMRRRRVAFLGVGAGAIFLLGAVVSLPFLPWSMGIVADAQHVFMETLPEENRGAYLIADRGVMQLYTWRVQPTEFPADAPTLPASSVRSLAVVQKQFDPPENYRLYNASTGEPVRWQGSWEEDMQLFLEPGRLSPGSYFLVVPVDSMFGGKSWHYFRLN